MGGACMIAWPPTPPSTANDPTMTNARTIHNRVCCIVSPSISASAPLMPSPGKSPGLVSRCRWLLDGVRQERVRSHVFRCSSFPPHDVVNSPHVQREEQKTNTEHLGMGA